MPCNCLGSLLRRTAARSCTTMAMCHWAETPWTPFGSGRPSCRCGSTSWALAKETGAAIGWDWGLRLGLELSQIVSSALLQDISRIEGCSRDMGTVFLSDHPRYRKFGSWLSMKLPGILIERLQLIRYEYIFTTPLILYGLVISYHIWFFIAVFSVVCIPSTFCYERLRALSKESIRCELPILIILCISWYPKEFLMNHSCVVRFHDKHTK